MIPDHEELGFRSANAMYRLLKERYAINSSGDFVWDNAEEEGVESTQPSQNMTNT